MPLLAIISGQYDKNMKKPKLHSSFPKAGRDWNQPWISLFSSLSLKVGKIPENSTVESKKAIGNTNDQKGRVDCAQVYITDRTTKVEKEPMEQILPWSQDSALQSRWSDDRWEIKSSFSPSSVLSQTTFATELNSARKSSALVSTLLSSRAFACYKLSLLAKPFLGSCFVLLSRSGPVCTSYTCKISPLASREKKAKQSTQRDASFLLAYCTDKAYISSWIVKLSLNPRLSVFSANQLDRYYPSQDTKICFSFCFFSFTHTLTVTYFSCIWVSTIDLNTTC